MSQSHCQLYLGFRVHTERTSRRLLGSIVPTTGIRSSGICLRLKGLAVGNPSLGNTNELERVLGTDAALNYQTFHLVPQRPNSDSRRSVRQPGTPSTGLPAPILEGGRSDISLQPLPEAEHQVHWVEPGTTSPPDHSSSSEVGEEDTI